MQHTINRREHRGFRKGKGEFALRFSAKSTAYSAVKPFDVKGKVLEQLEIIDIADDGKSLGKQNGLVIFVKHAIPGDVVDVMVTRKKRSYVEGKVVKRHVSSAHRVEAMCKHFGVCGGCKWQDMNYAAQLQFKQKHVFDSMQRLGNIVQPDVLPIIPSAETKYYRNKLDFSFADKKWLTNEQFSSGELFSPGLGFHIPGMFDKVLDIDECWLQPEPSNAIRSAVKEYAVQHNLSFMNIRNKAGLLRSLIIRSTLKGDLMVIVMVYENNSEQLNGLLDHLATNFPQITSLMYVVNPKANDTMHDLDVQLYKGEPYITEQMEDLNFRIQPKSFFQTNPKQALQLYQITRDFAALTGNEIVYDLYTGTGTIANFVAHQSKKVVGVEYVPDAIEDAKLNSSLNNISNTEFFAGDMMHLLTDDFFALHGKPDVVITDPPRAGMHPDVVAKLLHCGAQRIVYVSCNPATQARDISLLNEKYEVVKLQPVDMFPHTEHVENVALLGLRA